MLVELGGGRKRGILNIKQMSSKFLEVRDEFNGLAWYAALNAAIS